MGNQPRKDAPPAALGAVNSAFPAPVNPSVLRPPPVQPEAGGVRRPAGEEGRGGGDLGLEIFLDRPGRAGPREETNQ